MEWSNLKLASDDETLAENKVLILYVLEKANKPLTNDVLYKIVLAAVDMNYFYFQQFMLDLINVGYIFSFQKEDQTLYQITDSGKTTLDLTLDLLHGIIKLREDTMLRIICCKLSIFTSGTYFCPIGHSCAQYKLHKLGSL